MLATLRICCSCNLQSTQSQCFFSSVDEIRAVLTVYVKEARICGRLFYAHVSCTLYLP